MNFDARMDKSVQIMSVLSIALILFGLFFLDKLGAPSSVTYLYFGILILTFSLTYAFSPRGYSIDNSFIKIKRLIGNVKIPISSINEIQQYEKFGKQFGTRLIGSGGLFGHFGIFWYKGIGITYVYLSSTNDVLRIKAGKKNYIISPYPHKEFINTLQSYAGSNLNIINQ